MTLCLSVKVLLQRDVLILVKLKSLHDVLLDVVSQFKLWPSYRRYEDRVDAMFNRNRSDGPTAEDLTIEHPDVNVQLQAMQEDVVR